MITNEQLKKYFKFWKGGFWLTKSAQNLFGVTQTENWKDDKGGEYKSVREAVNAFGGEFETVDVKIELKEKKDA